MKQTEQRKNNIIFQGLAPGCISSLHILRSCNATLQSLVSTCIPPVLTILSCIDLSMLLLITITVYSDSELTIGQVNKVRYQVFGN